MLQHGTDSVVEELVDAACGDQSDARTRHIFTQALHGLVRLAKSEQLLAMRLDAEKALGTMATAAQRRYSRALLRKLAMDANSGQRCLQFGADDRQGPERG